MVTSDLKLCKSEIWSEWDDTAKPNVWSRGAALPPFSILSHAFHILCCSDNFFSIPPVFSSSHSTVYLPLQML